MNSLRFADDVVLMSETLADNTDTFKEQLNIELNKIGLKINMSKQRHPNRSR